MTAFTAVVDAQNAWPEYPGYPEGPEAFIHSAGSDLLTPEGKIFLVKGIAFGNHVWGNPSSAERFTHHGPEDYQTVKTLGFNAVRFYINYGLFEDDSLPYQYKPSGFAWLDKNIAAARSAGVYLIINMHYPQGGFQSNGNGDALWTDSDNQKRLIALWTAIARRYKDEEIILGYGLVNEPVPLLGVWQWTALAQNIINGIRSVDPAHLLFVERACWLKSAGTEIEQTTLFFPQGLTDPGPNANLVYEYHMYEPLAFTHQNAGWVPSLIGKFARYPDEKRLVTSGESWAGFSDSNQFLPSGTTGWRANSGRPFQVTNPSFQVGRPVIQAQGLGPDGVVYADDIVIEEYNPAGKLIRTTVRAEADTGEGWYFWSRDGSGSAEAASGIAGASGSTCLTIAGTTADANYAGSNLRFPVIQNHSYKISGRLRGENIAQGAAVRLRIDFSSVQTLHSWNKDFLISQIKDYRDYSRARAVPLYLGEFGAIAYSFEEDRGGERWVSDMLEILVREGVNYTYHTYHETMFGLFTNRDSAPPDRTSINQPLWEIFLKQ